jgi:hypothetical protein
MRCGYRKTLIVEMSYIFYEGRGRYCQLPASRSALKNLLMSWSVRAAGDYRDKLQGSGVVFTRSVESKFEGSKL